MRGIFTFSLLSLFFIVIESKSRGKKMSKEAASDVIFDRALTTVYLKDTSPSLDGIQNFEHN